MSNPGHHHAGDGAYRPPELIASIALTTARQYEQQIERDGQLYLMAELLAALHRQAEALETIHCHLSDLQLSLITLCNRK